MACRARDAEKSEAEKAALKAEYDRKLDEQQLKMEEQMRKEREDMRVHLTSVLEYKARCERDWCDALQFQPVETIQLSRFHLFSCYIIGFSCRFEQAKAKDQKKALEGRELVNNAEERGKRRRKGSRGHTN